MLSLAVPLVLFNIIIIIIIIIIIKRLIGQGSVCVTTKNEVVGSNFHNFKCGLGLEQVPDNWVATWWRNSGSD